MISFLTREKYSFFRDISYFEIKQSNKFSLNGRYLISLNYIGVHVNCSTFYPSVDNLRQRCDVI